MCYPAVRADDRLDTYTPERSLEFQEHLLVIFPDSTVFGGVGESGADDADVGLFE